VVSGRELYYYAPVKVCVSCGKNLPDAAIICVFCRARQHEERLDPTPVKGIRHDVSPAENVRAAEGSAPKPAAPAPTPRAAEPKKPVDGVTASASVSASASTAPVPAAVPRPITDRDERSVLIQLGQWNRNERATLSVAGLATLAVVLGYQRNLLLIILALAIAAAGIAPLPRMARGAIAAIAGIALLWKMFGPAAAGGLALLPGALLTRAKSPASRLAQLWGLVAAGAIVAAYLVPRDGVTLARIILEGFRAEHFAQIAMAIWLTLAIPLAIVGLLALTPKKTIGGCVLWASLMLLWAPVGLLLLGFWTNTIGPSLALAVMILGASTAGALGLTDLSA
jgi:hypothetical protein